MGLLVTPGTMPALPFLMAPVVTGAPLAEHLSLTHSSKSLINYHLPQRNSVTHFQITSLHTHTHTLAPFPGLLTSVSLNTMFSHVVITAYLPSLQMHSMKLGGFVLFTATSPVPRPVCDTWKLLSKLFT